MGFNIKCCLAVVVLLSGLPALANDGSAVRRTEDVIYGRKHGMALTLDAFQPARGNGCGLLFLVNGGWQSSKATPLMVTIRPEDYQPFLERGIQSSRSLRVRSRSLRFQKLWQTCIGPCGLCVRMREPTECVRIGSVF